MHGPNWKDYLATDGRDASIPPGGTLPERNWRAEQKSFHTRALFYKKLTRAEQEKLIDRHHVRRPTSAFLRLNRSRLCLFELMRWTYFDLLFSEFARPD